MNSQNDQGREDQALQLLLANQSLVYLEESFPVLLPDGLKQTLSRQYKCLIDELSATLNTAKPVATAGKAQFSISEWRAAQ